MPRDDAYYSTWIVNALKHTRYWMRKMGLPLATRRAIWRYMMEGER